MNLINKKIFFFLFFACLSWVAIAQEKQIKIKYPKGFFEHPKKPNAHKNKNQNPTTKILPPITPTNHSDDYGIRELTNELLSNALKRDTDVIRPLLGMSVFQGFYGSHYTKKDKITADWRWLVPKDFLKNIPPAGRVSAKNYLFRGPGIMGQYGAPDNMHFNMMGGNVDFGMNCSIENLLEYVFLHKRKAKDHWSHYDDLPDSALKNLSTEMPDSLVRLRIIAASEIKSLVKNDDKKFKIIYFFCTGDQKQSDNFKLISSYVNNHKETFCLVPLSDINNLSVAALCLKKNSYFEQAYVINRPEGLVRVLCKMAGWDNKKEIPSLFIIDSQNKIVDVETDQTFQLKNLESIIQPK